jgi:hypothetical protein
MFNQEFGQWSTQWAKDNNAMWEPFKQLQNINSETYEQISREWTSFMTDSMATLMKGMQTLPRIKNPEDYSNTQIKLLAEQGEKFKRCVENMLEIYQSGFKNQQDWMQEIMPSASKTTTEKGKR